MKQDQGQHEREMARRKALNFWENGGIHVYAEGRSDGDRNRGHPRWQEIALYA
jgi:hypothetical protein